MLALVLVLLLALPGTVGAQEPPPPEDCALLTEAAANLTDEELAELKTACAEPEQQAQAAVASVAPLSAGGPDAFGYNFIDSNEPGGPTYDFEDISSTGTGLSLGDDQVGGPIPIGFSFDYYGTDYAQIYVSSNGFLTVLAGQSHGCCSGHPLPTVWNPNGVIAGWWADLNPSTGGSIHYETLGAAPNRRFLVQFTNVPHFPNWNPATFQFKLFEGSSQIEVHYQAAPSSYSTHSAGIEDPTGTIGLQYYLGTGPLATQLAVRYLPNLAITSVTETPAAVNSPLVAEFTELDVDDTHTCTIAWDGTSQPGVIVEPDGGNPGTCTGTFPAEAGIYNITITVSDGVSDVTASFMAVVYDPSGGFVTGGGWIDSPAGAYYPASMPFFDGSYYELLETSSGLPWDDASEAANAMTLVGCNDAHLVTITSQEEQAALNGFFDGALLGKWYGGFQDEGETDPEAGWNWVTGEPWDYTNWAPGEPNDASGPGSEPHVIGWGDGGWAWNDEGDLNNVTGYVVEYDGCLTGKANFGFVSKYKKGAEVPTGNTEFQFHAAGLNFHSSNYQWLVVTGSNYARFKGVGTINGEGDYKFMLWAGDDEPDTFRIKIWEEDEFGVETVTYDNGMDQAIGGGSIVIHTKK